MKKFNPAYIGKRNDLLLLVPDSAKAVLDIGCSIGTLGKNIKQKYSASVYGIEYDSEMAEVAKSSLDKVYVGNVEDLTFEEKFFDKKFDTLIFGDVLEHLANPNLVLSKSLKVLKEDGIVIISLPNIRHYSTLYYLIFRNEWPMKERGIHDKTHLRFFTIKNIYKLLSDTGLSPISIKRKYRIIEKPSIFNFGAFIFGLPLIKDFFTHQFVIVAKRK
jgi:2-polyprenyl-3-methyl-5-hydroxy-6-metoxy-1,4-benzoquinol methylase